MSSWLEEVEVSGTEPVAALPATSSDATIRTVFDANPGKYDEISKETKEVLAFETWEGLKLDWMKPVVQSADKSFSVGHTLTLSTGNPQYGIPPSNYEPMVQVATNGFMVLARGMPSQGVMGLGVFPLGNWTNRVQCVISPNGIQHMVVNDYRGKNYSFGMMSNLGKQYSVNFLQALSRNWAVGLDLTYVAATRSTNVSFGTRWSWTNSLGGQRFASLKVTDKKEITAGIACKISDHCSAATELDWSLNERKSRVSLGLNYNYDSFASKMSIDSDMVLQSVLTTSLGFLKLEMSAQVQQFAEHYRFGIGLSTV
jgi:hypothetical protein